MYIFLSCLLLSAAVFTTCICSLFHDPMFSGLIWSKFLLGAHLFVHAVHQVFRNRFNSLLKLHLIALSPLSITSSSIILSMCWFEICRIFTGWLNRRIMACEMMHPMWEHYVVQSHILLKCLQLYSSSVLKFSKDVTLGTWNSSNLRWKFSIW